MNTCAASIFCLKEKIKQKKKNQAMFLEVSCRKGDDVQQAKCFRFASSLKKSP
jgi:hypothetical protein